MWWSKTVQMAQPEHGFAEPEPPKGGERLPFVMRRFLAPQL
jgi:hypothetical protein